MAQTSTSTVTGPPLAPGEYALDPSHTHVGFLARHLVVTKVRGTFEKVDARIRVGETLEHSGVDVTIDVASLDSRDEKRDAHLRSADFFDVEKFPTITFRSTGVVPAADGRYAVTGDLTIRDQTRPLTLDVEYLGAASTPWGTSVAVISAAAEIDREEWGLTWNVALESGGVLVSKRIQLEIEAELVAATAAAAA
ncbi:MAG: YceI family protein [Candidatus Dormibacteria bacterium]